MTVPDFDSFARTVDRLEASLRSHRVEMRDLEDRLDASRSLALKAVLTAAVGILAAIIGLAVTWGTHTTTQDVQDLVEQRAEDQQAARVASCLQQNVQTARSREALLGLVLAVHPEGGGEPSAQFQAFLGRARANIEEKLPYRDCTPEGIEEYFRAPAGPATSSTTLEKEPS